MEHPQSNAHTLTHQQIFLPAAKFISLQSVLSFEVLEHSHRVLVRHWCLWEKCARHPAHLLDTLAADSYRTLDERGAPAQRNNEVHTQRRGTLCIETSGRADTLSLGFIDVSPTSTDRWPPRAVVTVRYGHLSTTTHNGRRHSRRCVGGRIVTFGVASCAGRWRAWPSDRHVLHFTLSSLSFTHSLCPLLMLLLFIYNSFPHFMSQLLCVMQCSDVQCSWMILNGIEWDDMCAPAFLWLYVPLAPTPLFFSLVPSLFNIIFSFTSLENVRITNFCWSNWKLPGWEKTSRKDGCVVLRYEGTCSKNALRDVANWHTKRRSSSTKSQVLAWMIINSRRRSLNQLANYQKYDNELSWNVCIWQELVDLIF